MKGQPLVIHPKATILILLLLCAFAVRPSTASAQSTLFNIASTDVQPKHKVYLEADFLAHLTAYKNGGYQIFGMRVVYGLSKRTEIGLNAFYTKTSPAAPAELQPNFKLQLYSNEGNGVGVAVGTVVYIPVTHRSTTTTRGMVYAVASYMSGYTDDAIVRHGVLDGRASFLEKPLTPDAFTRKIREVLAG
jgi:hypothetical protein